MKKLILVFVCLFTAFTAFSQNIKDEVALIQSEYSLNKKQIIVDQMQFTEEESAKFWPLYDKYEIARKELGKKRVDYILNYADNYSHLTNEKASELIDAAFKNQADLTELQKKTFDEMSVAITPLRAAQFMQIEVYMETIVRMEISEQIPLVKDPDDKKKKH